MILDPTEALLDAGHVDLQARYVLGYRVDLGLDEIEPFAQRGTDVQVDACARDRQGRFVTLEERPRFEVLREEFSSFFPRWLSSE